MIALYPNTLRYTRRRKNAAKIDSAAYDNFGKVQEIDFNFRVLLF